MIPTDTSNYDDLQSDFETLDLQIEQPTHTYNLQYTKDRTVGWTDEQEAMKQAIFKILNTERYDFVIYSDNYGVELKKLIGKHVAYVIPEIERRISEALLWDSRITSVFDFEFDVQKKIINTQFKVNTIFGEIPINLGVEF
jgi:hypothetical protein